MQKYNDSITTNSVLLQLYLSSGYIHILSRYRHDDHNRSSLYRTRLTKYTYFFSFLAIRFYARDVHTPYAPPIDLYAIYPSVRPDDKQVQVGKSLPSSARAAAALLPDVVTRYFFPPSHTASSFSFFLSTLPRTCDSTPRHRNRLRPPSPKHLRPLGIPLHSEALRLLTSFFLCQVYAPLHFLRRRLSAILVGPPLPAFPTPP